MITDPYVPCQCEDCVRMRSNADPETLEFIACLDEMEKEHHLQRAAYLASLEEVDVHHE